MTVDKQTWMVIALSLLIGGSIGYGLGAHYDFGGYRNHNMHDASREPKTDTARRPDSDHMEHMMMNHENHQADMMVQSERAFIEHMIPHHQEAIDTAKEVLERGGTTATIRTLAESIITAQEQEIASMKKWYQSWYGQAYTDTNSYMPMMRDLEQLTGSELDRTFLTDMIMHHRGAVMMAESVLPHIEHTEMETLAQEIIRTQTAEIEIMETLLSTVSD